MAQTDIKFSISVPKDKAEIMMGALQYHDIIHTMELQSDLKHYHFKFSLSPMQLFDLGGTYFEYCRISYKPEKTSRK